MLYQAPAFNSAASFAIQLFVQEELARYADP